MEPQYDNDRALVAALLDGEPRAFAQFFHTNFPRLYRFALRRVQSPALAEEFAQEALVKGLRDLDGFRAEAALLTWLTAICRNEIGLWRRRDPDREALRPVPEDDPGVRATLELLADGAEQPEWQARRAETVALVQAVLDFLPAPYGDVLEWKYIEGLTVAEMAMKLGRSVKATESLLTRARDAFREAARDVFSTRIDSARP